MNKLETLINDAINPQPVQPQEIGEPTNRIVIVGTGHRFETKRDGKRFTDEEMQFALKEFADKLEAAHAKYDEVVYIHGQAAGWDRSTGEIAEWFLNQEGNEGKVLGRHPNYYTAKGVDAWTVMPKTAGTWRNHRMLEEGIDIANKMACPVVCLAWMSNKFEFSGSHHCAQSATEKGIMVRRIANIDDDLEYNDPEAGPHTDKEPVSIED